MAETGPDTTATTCTHITKAGTLGPTAEDERPDALCRRVATWKVTRPGIRPRYRCDDHVEAFRNLPFDDLSIEAVR